MSNFFFVAIGILIGVGLGSVGMFLLIKETETDRVIERQASSIDIDDPWDTEELPEPKEEIKYGNF